MKFGLITLLLIIFAAGASASEVSIRIQKTTKVRGPKLTLGDIAVLDGFTVKQSAALKSIALGNAPAYGEKRNFSNQALTEILRVHLKEIRASGTHRIKLQIPGEISVEGQALPVNAESVREALQDNLKKICEACEYKIEDLRTPEIPAFPPQANWSIRAEYHKLRGTFNIPIEVVSPIGEKSVYWVTGRVSVWKKVPVTTRMLAIQDRLEAADIKWVKRDITYLPDTTPSEPELVGAQLRSSVGPEQILLQSHLVRKHALNRGEVVTVSTGSTGWHMSLKGVAQEHGYIGDTVRVMNTETKKILVGRVTGQGMVEVK